MTVCAGWCTHQGVTETATLTERGTIQWDEQELPDMANMPEEAVKHAESSEEWKHFILAMNY